MVSATETAPARKAPAEGPRFGLATATFVVVSSMIGTGVLTTSGFTVYFVGSNQLMLALWVVGGVLALCGALTLCELSAALPRSGGDYVFLSEAYGPLAAFLSGWVSFLIGFGGPIAASASAAANYLAGEVDRPQERMPRAILLGTGLVLALYLALNTAYALALSAADVRAIVGGPENVNAIAPIAQIAADRLYGHRVADPLSVAIGLTLLASVSAYILTGPRVAYAMARAGQFPEVAGRLSARGTPRSRRLCRSPGRWSCSGPPRSSASCSTRASAWRSSRC